MSNFQVTEEKEYVLVACPMAINKAASQEFLEMFQGWMMKPAEVYVLDLKRTRSIEKQFFQNLVQIRSILKSNSKTLYSLNLAPNVLQEIRSVGMEKAFSPVASLADALASQAKSHSSLNMDFIQPFLVATKKVLEIQCQTKISPKTPKIRDVDVASAAIIGSILLESKGRRGRFSISFSMDVFRSIYFNMFGEKVEELTPDIADAVSEIVNIIYGQAKIELNKHGFQFDRAFPSAHFGAGLASFKYSVGRAVVLPFDSDSGLIEVDIEFESAEVGKAS